MMPQCLDVRVAEPIQARLSINLGGGNALVPQELLDMIEGHPRIKEDRGDAGAEAVRGDLLLDPRLSGCLAHDELDVARRILITSVTLEKISPSAARKMRLQFLREDRQDRYIPVASALGMGQVDLGRVKTQVQIRHLDMDELADARPSVESVLTMSPCRLDRRYAASIRAATAPRSSRSTVRRRVRGALSRSA